MKKRIAVCIPTYKRPAGLARLLAVLTVQQFPAECDVRILVVDNEASLLTREICEEIALKFNTQVDYCSEPRRGLSFVRNRAVEAVRNVADFLVFIDDDEVPLSGWLEHLIACQETYDADAVCGPVIPYFMSNVPQWMRVGRFFDRERYATGTHLKVGRTGNVLLKMTSIEPIGSFDDRYALTGGEDSEFFMRLYESGGRIIWSDEAIVEEWLPPSRTRLRWLMQRAFRTGSTHGLCLCGRQGRARIVLHGFLRSGKGVCLMIAAAGHGKPEAVSALQRVLFGVGMVAGAFGWQYEEYRHAHSV